MFFVCFFFFKQKTAYEMRISDWSSDVCSSDLLDSGVHLNEDVVAVGVEQELDRARVAVADLLGEAHGVGADPVPQLRVEVGRRCDLDDLLVAALQRAVEIGKASWRERGWQCV